MKIIPTSSAPASPESTPAKPRCFANKPTDRTLTMRKTCRMLSSRALPDTRYNTRPSRDNDPKKTVNPTSKRATWYKGLVVPVQAYKSRVPKTQINDIGNKVTAMVTLAALAIKRRISSMELDANTLDPPERMEGSNESGSMAAEPKSRPAIANTPAESAPKTRSSAIGTTAPYTISSIFTI